MTNQKLRQLKARISKLQDWLKEESENTEPPTLADYIQGILSRKVQAGKPGYSQSLYNLKGVMNGKTTIPTKTWKEEYTKLTAERKTLNQRYLALKEEMKEAEKIRKSVYSILRQEQREQQLYRKQDMER